MELEEALTLIEAQKAQIAELSEKANAGISKEELDKEIQKAHNKGFDKAKAELSKDIETKYLGKDEVEKMLSERDRKFKAEKKLMELGFKATKRTMRMFDEEDFEALSSDDFDEEKFREKFPDIPGLPKEEEEAPYVPNAPFMKNNEKKKEKLTAEQYAEMKPEERAKIPQEEKLALLGG